VFSIWTICFHTFKSLKCVCENKMFQVVYLNLVTFYCVSKNRRQKTETTDCAINLVIKGSVISRKMRRIMSVRMVLMICNIIMFKCKISQHQNIVAHISAIKFRYLYNIFKFVIAVLKYGMMSWNTNTHFLLHFLTCTMS
jgi:hypothetical protein